MDTKDSKRSSNSTRETRRGCTLSTAILATVIVVQLILTAFTACIFYQLMVLQQEVREVTKNADFEGLNEAISISRSERQYGRWTPGTFQSPFGDRSTRQRGPDGQDTTTRQRSVLDDRDESSGEKGPGGRDGSPGGRAVSSSYTSYIRWGRDTCTVGGKLMSTSHGVITALVTPFSSVRPGSDVHCVPDWNDVTGSSPSASSSVGLQAVKFALHGHADAFTEDKSGHIHCAYCEVKASDVITVTGRTVCPSNWRLVYRGVLVSHNGFGTTSSICMDHNVKLVDNQLHPLSSSGNMVPVKSGTSKPFSHAEKAVPCVVCYREETAPSAFRFGPKGSTGLDGNRDGTRDGTRDTTVPNRYQGNAWP